MKAKSLFLFLALAVVIGGGSIMYNLLKDDTPLADSPMSPPSRFGRAAGGGDLAGEKSNSDTVQATSGDGPDKSAGMKKHDPTNVATVASNAAVNDTRPKPADGQKTPSGQNEKSTGGDNNDNGGPGDEIGLKPGDGPSDVPGDGPGAKHSGDSSSEAGTKQSGDSGSEPGKEPNSDSSDEPGSRSSGAQGGEPENDTGAKQNGGSGSEPGSDSGSEPDKEPDSGSGGKPGSDSGDERIIAPDFTVQDADGNDIKLSDMVGKPVVVNFWASWCPPCKSEMPEFNKVYEEMGDRVQFMMIDVVDSNGETKEAGAKYVKKEGYTFPVFFDMEQDAAIQYRIRAFPTSIFIDSEGYVVAGVEGAIDEQVLRRGIELIYTGSGG